MQTRIKGYAARWTGVLLCVLMMIGALSTGAQAASISTVSATISPGITVKVDGVAQTFFSAAGAQVYPVLYNGTTYLPVRAIGELMGKNVNWDQSTLTVSLSGIRTAPATAGVRDADPKQQTIQAQLRPDFTIVVDSTVRSFSNVNGDTVYPMLYNGTTYLPIRAIGELMEKSVGWEAETRTVSLISPGTGGSLVTDADTFDPIEPVPSQTGTMESNTFIGEERARNIALAHAGLTGNQVTFVKTKLEYDNGRWEYDIEFYTDAYQEYDYEIDAHTGDVLKLDYDAEDWSAPPQDTSETRIGIDRAKSIALNHAGLTASQVRFVKADLARDDGRWEYEIKFIYETLEYEFEIDAYSGAVLSYEKESVYD